MFQTLDSLVWMDGWFVGQMDEPSGCIGELSSEVGHAGTADLVCVCVCVCVCMYGCEYMYVYVCMYVVCMRVCTCGRELECFPLSFFLRLLSLSI